MYVFIHLLGRNKLEEFILEQNKKEKIYIFYFF